MTTQNKTKGRTAKFLSLFLLVAICYGVPQGYKYLHRDDWKESTTPLPQSRIDYLCKNFGLDESHDLCNGEKDIYGPDFYNLIRDTFKPELNYQETNNAPATYEQVENKIGRFKIDCEPPVWTASHKRSYFYCYYDLRGDGKFVMEISYYYPENVVHEIMATTEKEPHD